MDQHYAFWVLLNICLSQGKQRLVAGQEACFTESVACDILKLQLLSPDHQGMLLANLLYSDTHLEYQPHPTNCILIRIFLVERN